MSNVVKKGAGRAAHAERTARHAQRTPLPPKGATKGVTKATSAKVLADEVGKAAAEKATRAATSDAAKMATLAVRGEEDVKVPATFDDGTRPFGTAYKSKRSAERAAANGDQFDDVRDEVAGVEVRPVPGHDGLWVRVIVPVVREPEPPADEPEPETAREEAPAASPAKRSRTRKGSEPKAAPEPATAKESPIPPTPTDERRRSNKARSLVDFALEAGWECDAQVTETPGQVIVTALREPETLTVTFIDNKLDLANMPTWEDGSGRRVLLRNVSAAKKQMSAPPEDRPVRPLARGSVRRRSEPEDRPRKSLPFSIDAPDGEVLKAFNGATVLWRNVTAGVDMEARVAEGSRFLKIEQHPRKSGPEHRVVSFMSADGTHRSLSLANLLSVRPTGAKSKSA